MFSNKYIIIDSITYYKIITYNVRFQYNCNLFKLYLRYWDFPFNNEEKYFCELQINYSYISSTFNVFVKLKLNLLTHKHIILLTRYWKKFLITNSHCTKLFICVSHTPRTLPLLKCLLTIRPAFIVFLRIPKTCKHTRL